MKKIVTILLLLLHLFSTGGSVLFHQYLKYRTANFFKSQTSKGLYNVKDLTEIKVPADMHISADWQEYQNISGVIEFESVSYNYVKMKITKNAIYLMCVPNYQTTRLAGNNTLNAKNLKNIPVPKKNHVPPYKFTLQANSSISIVQIAFAAPVKILTPPAAEQAQELIYRNCDIPEQPPRLAC